MYIMNFLVTTTMNLLHSIVKIGIDTNREWLIITQKKEGRLGFLALASSLVSLGHILDCSGKAKRWIPSRQGRCEPSILPSQAMLTLCV
jgi:hypothetical protein